MSWAWTRTFYASRNGTIFNFEAKRQRDDAVKHYGFEKMLSADAMKYYPNIVRVGWREYDKFIDAAPTIIPADLPVMYYPQVDGITPTIIPASGGDAE